MLDYEQKLAIIESFPELEKKEVSLGRVNFQYSGSVADKKNVVYHLHPNGNGYVYAKGIGGYETDAKGMVNIRDFSEEDLQAIIKKRSTRFPRRAPMKPQPQTGMITRFG